MTFSTSIWKLSRNSPLLIALRVYLIHLSTPILWSLRALGTLSAAETPGIPGTGTPKAALPTGPLLAKAPEFASGVVIHQYTDPRKAAPNQDEGQAAGGRGPGLRWRGQSRSPASKSGTSCVWRHKTSWGRRGVGGAKAARISLFCPGGRFTADDIPDHDRRRRRTGLKQGAATHRRRFIG